jgi:hypothetical protein
VNVSSILLWGFIATLVLSTTMAAGQGFGHTRMSLPFLLGTIFTPARDRAMVIGAIVQFALGILFALIYAQVFESLDHTAWWIGAGLALLQAAFVLTVGMAILPGLHPHMVSEYFGPTPNRLLQPPGFLALNYGRRTPIVTAIAHALYGAIVGGFYQLSQ